MELEPACPLTVEPNRAMLVKEEPRCKRTANWTSPRGEDGVGYERLPCTIGGAVCGGSDSPGGLRAGVVRSFDQPSGRLEFQISTARGSQEPDAH